MLYLNWTNYSFSSFDDFKIKVAFLFIKWDFSTKGCLFFLDFLETEFS
jgi:hypothetical protein